MKRKIQKITSGLAMLGLLFVSIFLLAAVMLAVGQSPAAASGFVLAVVILCAAILGPFTLRHLNEVGAIGQTSEIEKSQKCTAAIAAAFTIAKFGADDNTMSLATAATDALIGIFQHTTSAAGDAVRIMTSGISRVVYGDAVTRGDQLTSDGTGRAIKATVAGQSIIGFATVSGVANDIGFCRIAPSVMNPVQAVLGNTFKGLAIAEFDPSATAGLRTIAKHGLGVYLPDNAIITRTWYENLTTFTSATDAATIALGADTDAEAGIKAAVAISNGANAWDAGIVEGIQTGVASNFMTKLTAQRELCATVAVEALTAGKLRMYCEYVVSI